MNAPQPAALPELSRGQIIDLISPLSKNSADHDIEFANRVIDALAALQPAAESPCACWPGRMCSRSEQCARDVQSQPAAAGVSDVELLGAIARGWCHPKNSGKEVDADLAASIAEEIRAILALRPQSEPDELSPDFTDTARAALLWVLWHHQGGSSPVGQPIRYALGMGAHESLNAWQVSEAKRWAAITGSQTSEFHNMRSPQAVPMTEDTELLEFMFQHRAVVSLELEGGWDAELLDESGSTVSAASGFTPRDALRRLKAHHGITAPAGGEKQA